MPRQKWRAAPLPARLPVHGRLGDECKYGYEFVQIRRRGEMRQCGDATLSVREREVEHQAFVWEIGQRPLARHGSLRRHPCKRPSNIRPRLTRVAKRELFFTSSHAGRFHCLSAGSQPALPRYSKGFYFCDWRKDHRLAGRRPDRHSCCRNRRIFSIPRVCES